MKFKSQVLTQASGSVGGVTYSRNRYGMYQRGRAIPVNPNTARQVEVRNAMSELVTAYSSVLTSAQRNAWELYAQNVSVTDQLGDQIFLTGQNWYIGNNTALLQAQARLTGTFLRVDDGPTEFNRGDFTTPVVSDYTVTDGLDLQLDSLDAWANEDDAHMFVYQGAPQNSSRNFFKGPFRLIGTADGDSATPPVDFQRTAAQLATDGYAITTGQNGWLNVVVVRADGRATTKRILGPTTIGS